MSGSELEPIQQALFHNNIVRIIYDFFKWFSFSTMPIVIHDDVENICNRIPLSIER